MEIDAKNGKPTVKQFSVILILAIVFFCIDIFANKLYLYWSYTWFDVAMHFTGGLLSGTFFILLLQSVIREKPSRIKVFITSILAAFVIGSLWEMAEFRLGISHYSSQFVMDTSLDMLMNILGGILAYAGWYLFSSRKNNLN